jgi:hypothetical protein
MDLVKELGSALPAPIQILDIGSNPEGRPRYAEILPIAEVHGFDGQDDEEPIFLGDGEEHVFYTTRWPGCSSLLEPNPAIIDRFAGIGCESPEGNFHVIDKRVVKTERLDDFDLPPIDFVKLDTQGSELMIVQDGVEVISNALMIESEVEFLPVYKNQPLFADVASWMNDCTPFQFHRFVDLGSRSILPLHQRSPYQGTSQLMWADAVWTVDIRQIEHRTDVDLRKLAILAHHLYGSFDLAALCLSRTDEVLYKRYRDWFNAEGVDQVALLPIREN